VSPEFGGFPFDASFEGWKPISVTDRGDNNTLRFILGNDVAVTAARTGNVSPWPDGARFAKIAWQKMSGADGLVYPGKFIQVELMQKNAQSYKQTEGWGWGRWRGLELKPYGADARFVNECTTCHLPVRGNDYVYTLPMTAAKVSGQEVVNNAAVALPASLPYQPLGWGAITMYVDTQKQAVALLYGNDAAMQSVRAGRAATVGAKATAYPAGAVLALVTWAERDDPHWFGGRIPDSLESVEFVVVGADGKPDDYRKCGICARSGSGTAALAARTISGSPMRCGPVCRVRFFILKEQSDLDNRLSRGVIVAWRVARHARTGRKFDPE
jgi:hypothetical protein